MYLIGALRWFILYLVLFSRWNPILFCLSSKDTGHYSRADPRQRSFNSHKNPNLIRINIDRFWSTDKVKYKYDRSRNQHVFIARDPYYIKEVVDDRESLWKARPNDYPFKVILAYDKNGEEELKFVYPYPQEGSSDYEFDDSAFTPIEVADSIYTSYSYLALLNIKRRFCTDIIDYEYDPEKRTHKFTAVKPFLFGIIKKGNKTVWEARIPEYPDTVLLFPGKDGQYVMRLFFATMSKVSQVFEKPEAPLKPGLPQLPELAVKSAKPLKAAGLAYSSSDLSDLDQLEVEKRDRPEKLKKIDLNLSEYEPSDEFELTIFEGYHFDWRGTYIYKAKPGFIFNSVFQSKHHIWEAKNDSEAADKIGYSSSYTGVEQVIVYQVNGVKRKFYKCPGLFFSHWEEEFKR